MPPREVFFFNTYSGLVITRLSAIFPSLSSAQHHYELSYDKLLDRLQNLVCITRSPYKYRIETDKHVYEQKVLSFGVPEGGKAYVLKLRVWQIPSDGQRPRLGLTFHHDWAGVLVAAAVEAYAAMDVTRDGRMGIMSVEHDGEGLPKWTIEKEGGDYVTVEVVARYLPGEAEHKNELGNFEDMDGSGTCTQLNGAGGGVNEAVTRLQKAWTTLE